MNKNSLMERQLAALDTMTLAELNAKFNELYGFNAPRTNARNLRARLAYRIQEIYLGGVSEQDMETLRALADGDSLANLKILEKPLAALRGTRLIRHWHGKRHEVVADGAGKFLYDGKPYRSLTAVANAITGTRWNGKAFFGVN